MRPICRAKGMRPLSGRGIEHGLKWSPVKSSPGPTDVRGTGFGATLRGELAQTGSVPPGGHRIARALLHAQNSNRREISKCFESGTVRFRRVDPGKRMPESAAAPRRRPHC